MTSEIITTTIAFTSRSVAALRENDLANRRPLPPSLTITLGVTIAAVCSRCQSKLNYEFAMDRQRRAACPRVAFIACFPPLVEHDDKFTIACRFVATASHQERAWADFPERLRSAFSERSFHLPASRHRPPRCRARGQRRPCGSSGR